MPSIPPARLLPAFIMLLVITLSSLLSPSLWAQTVTSRQQAIDSALQQNGGQGKVLGVKATRNQHGQTIYEVKVLANGRVRVFRFTEG